MSLVPGQSLAPTAELSYLLPHEQAFWRWSGDGRAIEWRDGRTIAFREEVFAILGRLAPNGLPPFGAIVLLLAATRDNWNQHDDNAKRIIAGYSSPMRSGSAPAGTILIISALLPHRARQELGDVLGDLEAVASLPLEIRRNADAGRALAEMVFAGAQPSIRSDGATQIVEALAGGVEAEQLHQSSGSDSDYSTLSAELRALSVGLGRVGVEPLTQWMRTGLDRGVEQADIDVPAVKRVRGLLSELLGDPELTGVARLARDLLAAIHIPRVLVSPEDLPVGGVSDIANRGPLDRLLISELAYDDLTLAVRVALNEALYLRRESPAQHPPFARAILIDAGIRTWGIPRLYATAVALALAASADPRGVMLAHRPRSVGGIEHVDLLSREGITKHLESLDPGPHPGPSLQRWLDVLDDMTNADAMLETFIVTHEDALDDPQFLRSLRATDVSRDWHVATVARDGAFVLWIISRAGKRELCRADLNLDEISGRPKPKPHQPEPSSILVGADKNFPLILSMRPFPLLLPAAVDPRHIAVSREFGLIGISTDRRLMRWRNEKLGGEQLSATIPGGRISGVFVDDERSLAHVVVTLSRMNRVYILTADLRTGHCAGREYNRNHPLYAGMREGLIFLIYADHVCTIEPVEGAQDVKPWTAKHHWMHGRFFRLQNSVYGLSSLGLILVTSQPCVGAFDRADGPWLLTREGDVMPAAGEKPLAIHKTWRPTVMTSVSLLAVSADGNRLAVRVWGTAKNGGAGVHWLDLSHSGGRLQWQWINPSPKPDDVYRTLERDSIKPSTSPAVTLRNHFTGIFVTDSGELALQTWNGRSTIVYDSTDASPVLRDTDGRVDPRDVSRHARFLQTRAPQHARFTLKQARFKDGSQAWLDSRGMVHLVSSDRTLPQITLALSTHPIAMWTSDGNVLGPDFFLKAKPTMTTEVAAGLLKSFMARLK